MGDQAKAQADYRAALAGQDRDEARRRLALSLAISGDRTAALQTLSPLVAKRDPAAERARAFVLALSGDPNGALSAINAAMPGNSGRIAPFLQRLPALNAAQKAANPDQRWPILGQRPGLRPSRQHTPRAQTAWLTSMRC
jgi:hypothetical protein